MDEQNEIGSFVRRERRALGWTQEQLGLYAGVSAKFIVDLERGKPIARADVVNRVLAMFGKRLHLADLPRSSE